MSLDWLIIGGGIHGVHLAARLIGEAGVPADDVRLVDPASRLLERWRTCTAVTGMRHLRSSSVQHLDVDPWSLQRFAGKRNKRPPGLFAFPYERPALPLFDSHCDHVIDRFQLNALHLQGRATGCEIRGDGVYLRLSDGSEVSARRVVLALGSGDRPERPAWAPADEPRIQHVFQPGFSGWPSGPSETVVVLGGGLTAAQVSRRLADEGHRVHLVCRHEPRLHQFDSDPGWLGPKRMAGFSRVRDLGERRSIITEARHRGSVPQDTWRALEAEERVERHRATITGMTTAGDAIRLTLSAGAPLEADRVLLATGFERKRPGGPWLDELVTAQSLPCAACGFPIVDRHLRWHPRIHVSGPLAELELGPVAGNIAGARRAGDRLVDAVRREPARPVPAAVS